MTILSQRSSAIFLALALTICVWALSSASAQAPAGEPLVIATPAPLVLM